MAAAPKFRRSHIDFVHTRTFTPREYQIELLDAAKEKNIIACLGTGTGKTFIAVMLIREMAGDLRCHLQSNGKKSVFLVPTVPLVRQQSQVLQDHTDLIVGEYYRDLGVQSWPDNIVQEEIQNKQVLVMTPDICKHFVLHSFIKLSAVNLIIVDECHRAVKNHPYKDIMRCFDACPSGKKPRILGLSASLLNKKCKPHQLEEQIKNLERSLRSTVHMASDLTSLSTYATKPKETIQMYKRSLNPQSQYAVMHHELEKTLVFFNDVTPHLEKDDNLPNPVKQPKCYLMEVSHVLVHLGPWCTQLVVKLFMKEISSQIDYLPSDIHKLMILLTHTVLQKIEKFCEDVMENHTERQRILDDAPHKLKQLLEILLKYKPEEQLQEITEDKKIEMPPATNTNSNLNDSDGKQTGRGVSHRRQNFADILNGYDPKVMCGIVFVKQRVTAYALSHWLNQVSLHHPDFKFLSTNYIVGQGLSSQHRSRVESHSQEEVLRKFRTREYNLLIATSVVEEGLDVPKCNLVIRFDLPEDFRAYVQSKGRARAPVSVFWMLVPEDDLDSFRKEIFNYAQIEKILLQEYHDRDSPSEEEIAEHLADQKKEPYIPFKEEESPRVTMTSSIALVNRYCFKLPSDTFTKLTPKCQIDEVHSDGNLRYQCTLYLPINSPLKIPIVGDVMPSKALAKMAAALETCKMLHQIGELDDKLLPVGKEAVKFEEDMLEGFKQEEVPPGTPRPGTTKRRQYYYKRVAENLKGGLPAPETTFFLYAFSMKLTCPIPEEQNTRGRKIHDPASTPRAFGIITTKSIPPICSFPVFTRSGEVTIVLEEVNTELRFSSEQVHLLRNFHRYTFAEVLRLEKYPMLFSPEGAGNSFYVVPTNRDEHGWSVDWAFVDIISQQKESFPRKQTEKQRENFAFKLEDYVDAVVMPWYRNLDRPQFFYVAEICSELNPKSDFPDTGYETFEGYYRDKYSIKIMNGTQPLLDVDHTSARLNLLTPRYVNRKGMTLPTSSAHTKRAKRENLQQKQILIPELCVIHPFPASLWRKAVCLPCILYRINSLLLAEELRLKVANEIGVGRVQLENGFAWPALDFGWTLAEVLVKAQQALKEESQERPLKGEKNIGAPFRPATNNRDSGVESNMNFEIGTFDETEVHIPNDDDLLDQEIREINFGLPMAPSIGLWGATEPLVRVRYGSPSNFEGTGWDSEWDTEIDESNVFRLNIPGLGYISAPSGFNIQGLSNDLASCRDDDIWDSDYDDDSIYDDLEMEKPPEPNRNVEEQNIDDPARENKTVGEKAASRLPESQEDYFYKSDWLSDCNQYFQSPLVKDDLNDDENEEKIEKEMPSIEEHIKEMFGSASCQPSSKNNAGDVQKEFPMILNAIRCIDRHRLDGVVAESAGDQNAEVNFESWEYPENYDDDREASRIPAFGELLPDREKLYKDADAPKTKDLKFDDEVDLAHHSGPSPSIVLQAFTMSNANDGINLERLETVGDSFLKYAITAYLYCTYTDIHEGKLSYLRSKQISNLNLYRLGKKCGLGELMIGSKFEPSDNWLPPQYAVPKGLEQALIDSGMSAINWNIGNIKNLGDMDEEEIRKSVMEEKKSIAERIARLESKPVVECDLTTPHIRYNLLTQQSIPDKSIADCVEALIGAYLISCGPRGALLFMSWMGLKVLPDLRKAKAGDLDFHRRFGRLELPKSPLLTHVPDAGSKLESLLLGFEAFEEKINYTFRDRAYLLQAFTHASYHYNRLTDCYQRLEFLGDAVLDYLITRHLYEDPQQHYPGVLTDLRSALVNNTFFASLAVKYEFHKYFKSISPGLFGVINRFADMKRNSSGFTHFEEYYLEEDECEEAEEVEVPKALGDIFESVAGAIYLDSGMSLDVVWRVYYAMMKPEIEYFSTHVPKSPIRELLETYPQTARFDRAEITLTGKVRVKVEVVGRGQFMGIGRNKRIAKCTAAKRALRALKKYS